jgi:uncharacterized protein
MEWVLLDKNKPQSSHLTLSSPFLIILNMKKQEKQFNNNKTKPFASAIHFILYVLNQEKSAKFYTATLGFEPTLNVPGMTEFTIGDGVVLGLMPYDGVRKLFSGRMLDPTFARGVPLSEIYLIVPDPQNYHTRSIAAGALELSALKPRDWGDCAAYSLTPDNHILAFASRK